jgi:hypothetical protein
MAIFRHIEKILMVLAIAGIIACAARSFMRVQEFQRQETEIIVKSEEVQRFVKSNDITAPKRDPLAFSGRVVGPWTDQVPDVPPFRPWSFYARSR